MKTYVLYAVTPAIIASAVLLLSFHSVRVDTLVISYGAVAGATAIMALEYGFNWKSLFRR